MKNRAIAAVLIVFGASLPFIALAAVTPLVPCTSPEGVGSISCTLCTGVTLIQNIINYAIALSFPIAAIMFAWAGFLYFSSGVRPANITKAHQVFRAVAIGFVFVLAGYLIVNTILHTVIGANSSTFKDSSWFSVGTCTGDRPTSAKVSTWLGGLFSVSPTISVVSDTITGFDSSFVCPAGAIQAGPAGCASGDHYVLPSGYSCFTGTKFDEASGGCMDNETGLVTSAPTLGGQASTQCTASCSGNGICDPSSNSCINDTSTKCSVGTWGDYETGKCSTSCSGGQLYDWSSGDCKSQTDCSAANENCTSSTGFVGTSATSPNASTQKAADAADKNVKGTYGDGGKYGRCLETVRQNICDAGLSCRSAAGDGVGLMSAAGYTQVGSGSGNSLPADYTPQIGDVIHLCTGSECHWEIKGTSGDWEADARNAKTGKSQDNFNAFTDQPSNVKYVIYHHS